MKLAHLSDTHLGFRQFDRSVAGQNVRERDVADAFHRAIDDLLVVRPDLVVIAGDFFHAVRPPNGAILHAFAELQRLRQGLPNTPVVLVGGNHDTPRSTDTGWILGLYQALGVDVVMTAPASLCRAGVMVTAVPSVAIGQLGTLAPQPGEINVLLAHGEVAGIAHGKDEVGAGTLGQEWAYVALGHYHVMTHVGGRAWYSGALEFTSSDPWSEAGKPKGYLVVDLPGGEPELRTIATRRFVDLDPLDAAALSVPEINAAIRSTVDTTEPDGAVLRLRVTNISRETKHSLDHRMLRELRVRPLHLEFVWKQPADQVSTAETRAVKRKRLDEMVDDMLKGRELPPDVDRDRLRALGQESLVETE